MGRNEPCVYNMLLDTECSDCAPAITVRDSQPAKEPVNDYHVEEKRKLCVRDGGKQEVQCQ